MTSTTLHIDPDPGSDYPDDLYRSDHLADYVDTIADIGPEAVARYQRDGYLAVRRALGPAEVAEVLDGLRTILEIPGHDAVQWESWAADQVADATGEQRMDLVRKFMFFSPLDPRTLALARHDALVGVVRRLCGSDRVDMFQDMALLKPPAGGREKPWHQDNAYFGYEPGTPIVGVWIALDEATVDNGCMHVLPGTHREGPITHFRRRDWQLCDSDVDRTRDTAVPLPPGGALFFHGLLHHGTPTNHTMSRRRAVQLHYLPADTPGIPDERRLEIFGSEGTGATC